MLYNFLNYFTAHGKQSTNESEQLLISHFSFYRLKINLARSFGQSSQNSAKVATDSELLLQYGTNNAVITPQTPQTPFAIHF